MRARRAVPLLVAVLLCVAARVGMAAPDCVSSWGTGAVGEPRGVAVDHRGNLYVTDMAGHRLAKFRCDGVLLRSWGGPGAEPGAFRGPSAAAVNGSAQVFVADTYNHRIQKFSPDGDFLLEWGSFGSGPGDFRHPRGIAVDEAGQVYVADAGNNRIQKFTGKGVFLTQWATGAGETGAGGGGGRGEDFERPPDGGGEGGPGLLSRDVNVLAGPGAVAVDSHGQVYVLEGTRVLKFTDQGRLLASWGTAGAAEGELLVPEDLVVGPGDLVFVADRGNGRVQIFTATGYPVDAWSSTARDGGGGGGRPGDKYERPPDDAGVSIGAAEEPVLARPTSVAGDGRGHLYVVDPGRGAVFEFAYPSPPCRVVCDLDPRALGCGVVINSSGPLAMAVLGSPLFPSCDIDIRSLALPGGGIPVSCHEEDLCAACGWLESVPGADGCVDLVLRFDATQVLAAAGVTRAPGSGEVTLVGARRDGTPFWGSAPVTVARAPRGYPGPRPPEHYQRLDFSVPVDSPVTVRLFDVAGRLVRTLEDGFRPAGLYSLEWEANGLPAGVYFYRIRTAVDVEARKVVLLP